jgi:hypothetical protein
MRFPDLSGTDRVEAETGRAEGGAEGLRTREVP